MGYIGVISHFSNNSLMLQIPYEKVFRYPKATPKPLGLEHKG